MTKNEITEDRYERTLKKFDNLIRSKCEKFIKHDAIFGREDLYQLGAITLWDVMKTYNEDIGVRFSTYYIICLERRLMREIKGGKRKYREKKYKAMKMRENPLNYQYLDVDFKDAVDFGLLGFDFFSKFIFKLKYEGLTIDQISELFNISRAKVFYTNKIVTDHLRTIDFC